MNAAVNTTLDLHRRAIEHLTEEIHAVEPSQWEHRTPCTEWDVRTLVNHLVVEQLWVPELLAGRTVDEIGDRFDGDQLGRDPVSSWDAAAELAASAAIITSMAASYMFAKSTTRPGVSLYCCW